MASTEAQVGQLAARIRSARRILFVTGAGLSADSGLPTYRGVSGLYEGRDAEEGVPIEVALSGPMLAARPEVAWRHIARIEAACRGARPNPGHAAIAALDAHADVVVLTQNVDGLHHAAGSREVIDLHGDVRALRCTQCSHGERVADYAELTIPPTCPLCQSLVRPDVVLFEEMLPPKKLLRLQAHLAAGFDVAVAVGTSALFAYIAEPLIALRAEGAFTAEINPGASVLSDEVDLAIRDRAAPVLEAVLTAVAAG